MRRKISCPSCGAKLKPDAYYCDYCGTFFENEQSKIETEQLKRINEDHANHKVDVYDTQNAKPNIYKNEWEEVNKTTKIEEERAGIPQNEIRGSELTDKEIDESWSINNSELNLILSSYIKQGSGCLGGGFKFLLITLIMFGGVMLGSVLFNIILIIVFSGIFNSNKSFNTEVMEEYKKGDYGKARKKLLEKFNPVSVSSIKIAKQIVLIDFYRTNNFKEAKQMMEYLNKMRYSYDPHIEVVAKEMGVPYKEKSY